MEATGTAERRRQFSPRTRRALLTVHIAVSVALLGDLLALVAVVVRASGDAPMQASTSYEIVSMFSLIFGVPLGMTALATGLALGWGTRWGVLRYPWVTTKLVLTVAVLAIGALVVGPAEAVLVDDPSPGSRDAAEIRVLLGAAVQITSLLAATALSVFKPGRRRAPRRRSAGRLDAELAAAARH